MNWEIGIDIYKLLCIKQLINEDLKIEKLKKKKKNVTSSSEKKKKRDKPSTTLAIKKALKSQLLSLVSFFSEYSSPGDVLARFIKR